MAKDKRISTSQLALMTAAAVISLRGLPMMAQEELTMFSTSSSPRSSS